MSKILTVIVFLSVSVYAEGISKAEQMITMQKMESAMLMIQRGFLHDKAEFVRYGTEELHGYIQNVNNFMITVDKSGFDAKKYVSNEVKLMDRMAGQIAEEFEHGNKVQARFLFDQTLSRCMACHKTVRK